MMDNAEKTGQVRPEIVMQQDKIKERAFFDGHAEESDYNVFSDRANGKIPDTFLSLAAVPPRARIADLGCDSGWFAHLLSRPGFQCSGVDPSPRLIAVGRRMYPGLDLREGDGGALPFEDETFDAARTPDYANVLALTMDQTCSWCGSAGIAGRPNAAPGFRGTGCRRGVRCRAARRHPRRGRRPGLL